MMHILCEKTKRTVRARADCICALRRIVCVQHRPKTVLRVAKPLHTARLNPFSGILGLWWMRCIGHTQNCPPEGDN